ncbi:MAG: glycosyltransferase [Phycisphaerae bacterium]
MNILVKWPTRGRVNIFFQTLAQWRVLESHRHRVAYLIAIDADDLAMNSRSMLRRLAQNPDVHYRIGPGGRSKIDACNSDLEDAPQFIGMEPDVLILASDDMIPQVPHWDDIIAMTMAQKFPAMDGALHFDDGYIGSNRLITLSIMGWNLYRRFGYVYHPAYGSMFCDNEFTDVVRHIGKYHYESRVLFRHCHVGRQPDALFVRNQQWWDADKAMYELRTATGLGLIEPQLSLLIPSLHRRHNMLSALLKELHRQIFTLENPWQVEIHIALDGGGKPVGEKRDCLLRQARGKYIAFIDDDDMVADSYITDILHAIQTAPLSDCVVFAGRLEVDGVYAGPFDYSIAHKKYHQIGNTYFRTPNHLCPVKRELALQVGFKAINCGEDTDYAQRLYPLLKSEISIPDPQHPKSRKTLYYYRFSPTGTATQKR